MLWMFAGVVIIGTISGSISSALTLGTLTPDPYKVLCNISLPRRFLAYFSENVLEIKGVVGTVAHSPAEAYLRSTPLSVLEI